VPWLVHELVRCMKRNTSLTREFVERRLKRNRQLLAKCLGSKSRCKFRYIYREVYLSRGGIVTDLHREE
jgi:hypothetical protein